MKEAKKTRQVEAKPAAGSDTLKAKRRRAPLLSAPPGSGRDPPAARGGGRRRGRQPQAGSGAGCEARPTASSRPLEGAACSASALPLVREVFRRGAGIAPPSASHSPPRRRRRRTCCSRSTCLPAPSSRARRGSRRRQAARAAPLSAAEPPPRIPALIGIIYSPRRTGGLRAAGGSLGVMSARCAGHQTHKLGGRGSQRPREGSPRRAVPGRGLQGAAGRAGQLRSTEQIYGSLWLGCHAHGAGIKHGSARLSRSFFRVQRINVYNSPSQAGDARLTSKEAACTNILLYEDLILAGFLSACLFIKLLLHCSMHTRQFFIVPGLVD